MLVSIKTFSVDMDVKNAGVEFEVRDNQKNFKGDCYIAKTGLIWCEGKTQKKNGVKVSWDEFMQWMKNK